MEQPAHPPIYSLTAPDACWEAKIEKTKKKQINQAFKCNIDIYSTSNTILSSTYHFGPALVGKKGVTFHTTPPLLLREVRSGESTRLPPMWPGFKSQYQCHD